jgi:hypothetical protein
MSSITRRACFVVLLAASICAACGDDGTTMSPSTTTPARSTEVFGGRLDVGGSQFYSFSVSQSGTTEITLLSLRPAGVATTTLSVTVGLGLGAPAGTGCALSSATTASPALTTQLTVTTNPTTYCVKIADVGTLTDAVDYTIRILHP